MAKHKHGISPQVQAVPIRESISVPSGTTASVPSPAEPDYLGQLLRLKAEFENYRKRVDREKPGYIALGRGAVLGKLLPLYDLLQKAHQEVLDSHNETPLAKGMDGIFKEFDKLFREEGVAIMVPLNKPFDPLQHEVYGTVERGDCAEGLVVDVLQNGFLLQGRVLRTAKVRISRKPKKEEVPAPAAN